MLKHFGVAWHPMRQEKWCRNCYLLQNKSVPDLLPRRGYQRLNGKLVPYGVNKLSNAFRILLNGKSASQKYFYLTTGGFGWCVERWTVKHCFAIYRNEKFLRKNHDNWWNRFGGVQLRLRTLCHENVCHLPSDMFAIKYVLSFKV